MTTEPPPLTDEDLSAVLDGEADPDVAARAQVEPAARARLDELHTVRRALQRAPLPALDHITIDGLIDRALEETEQPVVAPPITRRGYATTPRWLVAAAVIALVAVGLGLVWSGRDRGNDVTTTASGQLSTGDKSAAGSGADGNTQGQRSPERSSSSPGGSQADATAADSTARSELSPQSSVIDLGEYGTLSDLRAALKTSFPTDSPSSNGVEPPSQATVERCAALMTQVFQLPNPATHVGRARVEARDVLVYEFDAPSVRDGAPTTFITVNEPQSCDAQLSFERTPG